MPTLPALAMFLRRVRPCRAGLFLVTATFAPSLAAADKQAVVLAFSPNFWNNPAIWTPAGEPNAGDNVFLGPAIDTPNLDLKNIPIFYASSRPDDTILGLLRISAPLYGGVTTGIINVGFVGSVPVIEPPLFLSRGVHQAGSTLRTTNEIIGDDQTGYFLQTGGLHTVENDVTLGWKVGSEGHYLLNAPVDGIFRVRRDLIVGDAGRGLFQKTSGTAIVQRDLWFGRGTGSDGVGMLSGHVDIWGNLTIGGSGAGTVFADTSPLSVGGDLYLGRSAGSVGSLSMSATAATLVAGNVIIGSGGRGDIVQTGVPSLLQATGSIIVAQDPASEGKLDSLLGAGVVAGLDLVIGDRGTGVGVNSTIPHVGRDLIVGRSAGGEGGYITTGNLLIGRDLTVGGGGKGAYTHNGPMEVVGNVTVGVEATGIGLIKSITPLWDLGGTLRVGLAGKGEVIMTGKVGATGTVTVGEEAGSEGYLGIEGLLAPPAPKPDSLRADSTWESAARAKCSSPTPFSTLPPGLSSAKRPPAREL